MNSRERIDAFFAGKSLDRKPNLTIVGSVVTQYTGIGIDTYCKDYKAMTDASLAAARDLDLDFIQVCTDLYREAEGFGGRLTFYSDKLPTLDAAPIRDLSEIDQLEPLDVKKTPRLLDLVRAVEYLSPVKDIYPLVGIVGPVTVASMLIGMEDFMMNLYDEPEAMEKLMEITTQTCINQVEALKSAGVAFMYMPDPVASLVSPNYYRDTVQALHTRIFGRMSELNIYRRLHMCGNTEKILPYSRMTGAQIIDVDKAVNFSTAVELAKGHITIAGNIDPVNEVYSATPDTVRNALLRVNEQGGDGPFILIPGCELPTATPLGNVKAIAQTIKELGA